MSGPLSVRSAQFLGFWTERHLATLTTVRADGTPHVVPVGVTIDPAAGLARVITSRQSAKARLVEAAGAAGTPVALCQVDGRRWSTLEGIAVMRADADSVAKAERCYAQRFRTPRENPARVVLQITIRRILGNQ